MSNLHSMARATAALAIFGATATGAQAATYAFDGAFNVDNDRAIFRFTVDADSTFVQFRTWGYGGTGTTSDSGTPTDASDDVTTPGPLAVDFLNGAAATEASIDAGNFDGVLTLFEEVSAGVETELSTNDNTSFHNPPLSTSVLNPLSVATAANPDGYARRQDSEIFFVLDAGVYYLVLTQWSNFYTGDETAATDDDGVFGAYRYDDYENYTNDTVNPDRATGCSSGYFCDVIAFDAENGYNRGEDYLVELTGVTFAEAIYTPVQDPETPVPLPAAAPMLVVGLAGFGLFAARRVRDGAR